MIPQDTGADSLALFCQRPLVHAGENAVPEDHLAVDHGQCGLSGNARPGQQIPGIMQRTGQLQLSGAVEHGGFNIEHFPADGCPGKAAHEADLILLDFNQPHLIPCHNVLSQLVYAASGHDVALTMVRGKILYADGKYPTLDIAGALKELHDYAIPRVFSDEPEAQA